MFGGSYAAWRGTDPKWPTNDANGWSSDAWARFPKNDAIFLGLGFPASGEREKRGKRGVRACQTFASQTEFKSKGGKGKKAFMARHSQPMKTGSQVGKREKNAFGKSRI